MRFAILAAACTACLVVPAANLLPDDFVSDNGGGFCAWNTKGVSIAAQPNTYLCAVRAGELWWHDLNYTVGQVTKHGARPVMWADAIWSGREEFLRRASRDILMSNWYYGGNFSEKKQQWGVEAEREGGWDVQRNGLAAFLELEKAGFDQLPCGSNWDNDKNVGLLADFCLKRIDPSRLKGFCVAQWDASIEKEAAHMRAGISQLSEAKRRCESNNL